MAGMIASLYCRGRRCRAFAATVLALACGSVALSACAGNDGGSAEDVANRFAKMHVHEAPIHGSVRVSVPKSGKMWVVVGREDLKAVAPQKCSIDGDPMGKVSEDIDMPASMAAEKAAVPGGGQSGATLDGTLFAFAQADVDGPREAVVYCEIDDAEGAYVVYEPSAD